MASTQRSRVQVVRGSFTAVHSWSAVDSSTQAASASASSDRKAACIRSAASGRPSAMATLARLSSRLWKSTDHFDS